MRFRIYPRNPFYRTAFLIGYFWLSYDLYRWLLPAMETFSEKYGFRDAENFFLLFLAIAWLFFLATFALEIPKKQWKVIVPYAIVLGVPALFTVEFFRVYEYFKHGEEVNGQIIDKNSRMKGRTDYRVNTEIGTYRMTGPRRLNVGQEVSIIVMDGEAIMGKKADFIVVIVAREIGRGTAVYAVAYAVLFVITLLGILWKVKPSGMFRLR